MTKRMLMALLAVVLSLGVMGTAFAEFSDMEKETIKTDNALVEIGARTGFPLEFENLLPCVWSEWKQVTVENASTVMMDLYVGLQSKGLTGEADLKDVLDVQIQWWNGSAWETKYNSTAYGLFAAWQAMADDMPVDAIDTYRLRVHLHDDVDNTLQGGWTKAWVLLYGVQYNGSGPGGMPWNYTPLP